MPVLTVHRWRARPAREAAHDIAMRAWTGHVRAHQHDANRTWKLVRYMREVDRVTAAPTGFHVLLIEHDSFEACRSSMEQGEGWFGSCYGLPREETLELIDPDSLALECWRSNEETLWMGWHPTTARAFFDMSSWIPLNGSLQEHDRRLRAWAQYVRDHHDHQFQEWSSSQYWRHLDPATGMATNRYTMLFEFTSHAGYLAFKQRRGTSPAYHEYLSIDPHDYFNMDTMIHRYWQPWDTLDDSPA